jgi:hypothetical protein
MADNMFRTPADPPLPKVAVRTPNVVRPSQTNVPESGYESELLAWVLLASREGEALLRSESASEDTNENMQIAMGDARYPNTDTGADARPKYLSNYTMNRIGKNIDDLASSLTDFRPIGTFKTYNTLYESQGQILDKLMTAWWYNNNIDIKMLLLVKDSLVKRTAYAHIIFNPSLKQGVGDLDLHIKDYRDILPIRPNSKDTIQDSVGIIIKTRNTVNWGRARFPEKAARIVANNEGALSVGLANTEISSPILDHLQRDNNKKQSDFAIPTYDHYEIYVRDGSINNSGSRKWVGPGPEDSNPWGYWVKPGEMLYPGGRLIVIANLHAILFDGGNPYWHGMFPVIKLTLNPWAHSLLGKSAMADAKSAYKASNDMLQGVADACHKALNPGIYIDRNAANRQVIDNFDSRKPGFKFKMNQTQGQGLIVEKPPELPPYVMELWQKADQHQDHVMGILDMRSLMQLKQMNADTTVESLLENLGPTIRTKGRVLESFMRELGAMMRGNFMQFYTVAQRVEILGVEGADFEDYYFDPGTLVPTFTGTQFAESFGADAVGEASRFATDEGLKSRAERAREHLRSFTYFVAPGSLLSLAKTQDKLLYLQLFRAGIIDPVTLLEKLEIPNIGELPGSPKTIIERMQAAAEQGYEGAVSAAGRKASGQQPAELRPDGRVSESG